MSMTIVGSLFLFAVLGFCVAVFVEWRRARIQTVNSLNDVAGSHWILVGVYAFLAMVFLMAALAALYPKLSFLKTQLP